jgi:hypothetical protein
VEAADPASLAIESRAAPAFEGFSVVVSSSLGSGGKKAIEGDIGNVG